MLDGLIQNYIVLMLRRKEWKKKTITAEYIKQWNKLVETKHEVVFFSDFDRQQKKL
jgi:hypothetical protein